MRRTHENAIAATLAALAMACSSDPIQPPVPPGYATCPAPHGEFSPSYCAIVRGSANGPSGSSLVGHAVRVQAIDPLGILRWSSNADSIDPTGEFELTVYLYDQRGGLAAPSAWTVDIELFSSTTPPPQATPISAIAVEMQFARMGEQVKVTNAELEFPIDP